MRVFRLVAAGAGLVWVLGGQYTRPALAAPPRQSTGDGLKNTSFEGDLSPWTTWAVVYGSDCHFQQPNIIANYFPGNDEMHVLQGHQSVKVYIDGKKSYWAGVYQTVGNITPGTRLRFTANVMIQAHPGWERAPSNLTGEANMRAGIDPTGGTSASAASVVWSAPENRFDTYGVVSVEATAQASAITVFVSANPTDCNERADAYFDQTDLIAVGFGPTDTPIPPPTATPSPGPTATTAPPVAPTAPSTGSGKFVMPTPLSDGSTVYVVQPGDTLLGIAIASGASVEQLQALNHLSDTNIIIGQALILFPAPSPTQSAAVASVAATTPAETPTAVAVAQAPSAPAVGKVCLLMFDDANGDALRNEGEALLAGGKFRLIDAASHSAVGEYQTDGAAEPHCFDELATGTYLVDAAAPEGHALTTTDEVGVVLPPQSAVNLEFGAQAQADFPWAVVGGVAGLLLAGGVGGFFYWRRRPRPQIEAETAVAEVEGPEVEDSEPSES